MRVCGWVCAPEVKDLVGGLLGEEGDEPQVRQHPHHRDRHPRQRHDEPRPLPPPRPARA